MKAIIILNILLIVFPISSMAKSNFDAKKNCEAIIKYKSESSNDDFSLSSSLASFFKKDLHIKNIKTESIKKYSVDKEGLKNYIFLYAPFKNKKNISRDVEEFNKVSNELKQLEKNLKVLSRSDSIKECIENFKTHPVDEDHYNNLYNKLERNKVAIDAIGNESTIDNILRLEKSKRIKNNWIISFQTELNDLFNILNSPDTGSVILVSHANSRGELFDSKGKAIPVELFKNISPSIHTLSIFSCFGKKVFTYYKLKNLFSDKDSSYKKREINYVELTFKQDKTPIHLFISFLKKIDRKIHQKLRRYRTSRKRPIFSPEL
ncbi:MAG: hypothetical protein VX341_04925, partial [Bdellovibrionota bacterium]|nr:hypothetical protein [Bdellovibrionota bacterium]